MAITYETAVRELAEEARLIREAYPKEPSGSRRDRLRAMRGKIRDEIFELTEEKLQNSSKNYKPINDRFKKSKSDLVWIENQAETFQLNASKVARLAELATKFAVLL